MSNELSVQTFDKFADAYDQKYRDFPPYVEACDRLSTLLSKDRSLSVLDVACGPAHACRHLIEKGFNLNVSGFDLSPKMVDAARRNVPNGTFKVSDCRNFDVFAAKFDVLICAFFIPYLNPDECSGLIEYVSEALAPGGVAYVSFIEASKYFSEYKTSASGDSVQTHYYTADNLLEKFSQYGLQVLHLDRKKLSTDGVSEVTEAFFYVTNRDI